jgi:hypothetical protein
MRLPTAIVRRTVPGRIRTMYGFPKWGMDTESLRSWRGRAPFHPMSTIEVSIVVGEYVFGKDATNERRCSPHSEALAQFEGEHNARVLEALNPRRP